MTQNNKPILMRPDAAAVYNFNDPDGSLTMLDKDFSGCTVMLFMSQMDISVRGKVFLDGKAVDNYVYKYNDGLRMAVLGVYLRGHVVNYGQKFTIRAEGFKDTNGIEIEPTEFEYSAIEKAAPDPNYAEHEAIALQAAEEGIVLLKNENAVLPLKHGSVLNFFGKGLYEFRVTAVGAGRINARYTVCLREAIEEHSNFRFNKELEQYYKQNRNDSVPDNKLIEKAKKANDTAFIVISRSSGENIDNYAGKGSYLLTDGEEALFKTVTKEFTKTVLILNTSYPIDLSFTDKYNFDAIIFNGLGGMLAGKALAEILDGRVNPSGKLPYTWAKCLNDIPADRNFYKYGNGNQYFDGTSNAWVDTVYEEDIYVGYRYFETFGVKPAYSFGHGLSYTSFSIKIDGFKYNHANGAQLKITVNNTGNYSGKEVVQLYVSKPDGKLEKPSKELVSFEKTDVLSPRQSQTFEINIPKKNMTSYDESKAAYILEQGEYRIFAGSSLSAADLAGIFVLSETEIIKQVKNRMQPVKKPQVLSKTEPAGTYPKGLESGIKKDAKTIEPIAERSQYPILFDTSIISSKELTFKDVQKEPKLLSAFVNQLKIEELIRLSVCSSAGWGMESIGEAGWIFKIEGREIPNFIVADGNSGVNVKRRNIGMPSGVSMSASFNKELVENIGIIIGEEAKENNVNLILAPGMNILRHPLNGRNPEYFSEDPYLSGVVAGTYCKGLESTGTGGCYKHCIANNCETARKRNQSIMTERALREIYFKNFEIAMEICNPASIMTAYNGVNGKPTSSDADLILGLFREECGFDGYVMTDWTAFDTADTVDMVNAGNCWITPGTADEKFTKPLIDAVNDGRINIERLKQNVYYLLKALL